MEEQAIEIGSLFPTTASGWCLAMLAAVEFSPMETWHLDGGSHPGQSRLAQELAGFNSNRPVSPPLLSSSSSSRLFLSSAWIPERRERNEYSNQTFSRDTLSLAASFQNWNDSTADNDPPAPSSCFRFSLPLQLCARFACFPSCFVPFKFNERER